jgi:uncharacterized protein YdaU (DUF1376 family)
MEPLRWDRGTDDLTLEQEAAYLRVCNAIYAADQPIRENYRMLSGMWRCNERKAKRLLAELVEAGKLHVEGGWIINEKAVEDVSKRRALRVKRQLAGHSGGIESGKSRANPPETKEKPEASASTRKEVETEVEVEVEAEKKKGGPRKRGSRIPEGWKLSDEDRDYALSKGLPPDQIERQAERFRNYWLAKAGREACKVDWHLTWCNWSADEASKVAQSAPKGPAKPAPNREQALDNLERAERAGRQLRADILTADLVEGLIARSVFTRETAAAKGYPLAAAPLRREA